MTVFWHFVEKISKKLLDVMQKAGDYILTALPLINEERMPGQ